MQALHRTIHPEIQIDDEKSGICTYVASDQTLDMDQEIIMSSGWKFTNFQKNSPFVDNHDYSSIDKLIGKVVDFKVKSAKLVETVQWALGVGNELAELGWKMTEAGYLRAVSIGFFPTQSLTPNSRDWKKALSSLGLGENARVKNIYTEQEQVELSAVIIGANPNALQCAYKDGVLRGKHLDKFPEICRAVEAASRPKFYSFRRSSTSLNRF